MAYGEHDNEDDDYGSSHSRSSYGGNSSHNAFSSSPRSSHSAHTSDFNTTLLSDDGRFLGIKLSPDMAQQARNFFPAFKTMAAEKGADFITKLYRKGGHSHLASTKAGNVAGYAIAFSDQIIQVSQYVADSVKSLSALRTAVQPLTKVASGAASAAPLSGNNEVVANARAKISGIFEQRIIGVGASLINTVPSLILLANRQKGESHRRILDAEMEAAKGNPDKIAELYSKELSGAHLTEKGFDVRDMQRGKEIYIEKHRVEYQQKFDSFKKANEKTTRESLLSELNKLKTKDIEFQLPELRRLGFHVEDMEQTIQRYRNDRDGYYLPKDKDNKPLKLNDAIEELIKRFQKDNKRNIDRVASRAVKEKFVRQEGAFDETWTTERHDRGYGYRDHDREPTIKKQLEDKINKIEEDRRKADHEKSSGHKKEGESEQFAFFKNFGFGLAAGLFSEYVTKLFGGKALEKYKQPIALDRILHLRRELEKSGDNPERVPPIPDTKDQDMGYVKYVHSIFQQHQKDCNRADIGDRFTEHLEKARWDDAAIQNIPDEELNPYEYAIKTIAKRIKDGRMDAIALVELVGDKSKKLVREDGRSFGPRNAGKDDAAIKAAILKIVDEKTALINGGQQQTQEQVNDKLGNYIFSVDDLKKALESNELPKDQRAFIFTVFSDVVGTDEKLCQKLGITNERCQELRKESKEHFNTLLDGAVTVLAEMIEKEPEVMEKTLKLTDKEKNLLRSLSEKIKDEGKSATDLTENREEIKSLETVVANATMALAKEPAKPDETGKPKNFWQRVAAAAKDRKEALKNPVKKPSRKKEFGEDESFDKPEKRKHSFSKHRDEDGSRKEWADDVSTSPRSEKWAADHDEEKSFTGREQRRKSTSLSSDAFDAGLAP